MVVKLTAPGKSSQVKTAYVSFPIIRFVYLTLSDPNIHHIAPAGWQLIRMNLDPNVPSITGEDLTMMGFGSTTNGISAPPNSQSQLQEAPTVFNDCAVARNPETGASSNGHLFRRLGWSHHFRRGDCR
jgi:hypothetical protein